MMNDVLFYKSQSFNRSSFFFLFNKCMLWKQRHDSYIYYIQELTVIELKGQCKLLVSKQMNDIKLKW